MAIGKQFTLENFTHYLIHTTPDLKYKDRHKICETVKRLGKQAVIDELAKAGKSNPVYKNEAIIMIRTVRNIT